eukprot:gene17829-biopygen4286
MPQLLVPRTMRKYPFSPQNSATSPKSWHRGPEGDMKTRDRDPVKWKMTAGPFVKLAPRGDECHGELEAHRAQPALPGEGPENDSGNDGCLYDTCRLLPILVTIVALPWARPGQRRELDNVPNWNGLHGTLRRPGADSASTVVIRQWTA